MTIACRLLVALLVLATLLMVVGCSSSPTPGGAAADSALIPKIVEYAGDGGGSLKPWPFSDAATDQPGALATRLLYGGDPKNTTVPERQTNWFRLDPFTTTQSIVILLQPTANEDSDLIVMRGNSFFYPGKGDDCVGYSLRTPSPGAVDAPRVGGFAPDWVAIKPGDTQQWPAAQIAVYGVPGGATPKHYFIEVDVVVPLTVGGAAKTVVLTGGHSAWYKFAGTAGQPYMVQLDNVSAGDPDVYVYGNTSSKYVAKHDEVSGGSAAFTATESTVHYARVRAHNAGTNRCTINVVNQAP